MDLEHLDSAYQVTVCESAKMSCWWPVMCQRQRMSIPVVPGGTLCLWRHGASSLLTTEGSPSWILQWPELQDHTSPLSPHRDRVGSVRYSPKKYWWPQGSMVSAWGVCAPRWYISQSSIYCKVSNYSLFSLFCSFFFFSLPMVIPTNRQTD